MERVVYGAISEKEEDCITYMKKCFSAINDRQKDCNWLITDFDGYPQNSKIADEFNREYSWISGEKLTKMIELEDFPWVWAVLSGFNKDIKLEDVLKYELPYANGNPDFWKKPISLQNPLASIEIVPWDGMFTLIFSTEKKVVDDFKKAFPLSENIEDYIDK